MSLEVEADIKQLSTLIEKVFACKDVNLIWRHTGTIREILEKNSTGLGFLLETFYNKIESGKMPEKVGQTLYSVLYLTREFTKETIHAEYANILGEMLMWDIILKFDASLSLPGMILKSLVKIHGDPKIIIPNIQNFIEKTKTTPILLERAKTFLKKTNQSNKDPSTQREKYLETHSRVANQAIEAIQPKPYADP